MTFKYTSAPLGKTVCLSMTTGESIDARNVSFSCAVLTSTESIIRTLISVPAGIFTLCVSATRTGGAGSGGAGGAGGGVTGGASTAAGGAELGSGAGVGVAATAGG